MSSMASELKGDMVFLHVSNFLFLRFPHMPQGLGSGGSSIGWGPKREMKDDSRCFWLEKPLGLETLGFGKAMI